jgi:hypothetical protein
VDPVEDLQVTILGAQLAVLESHLPAGELDVPLVEQVTDDQHRLVSLLAPDGAGYYLADDLTMAARVRVVVPGVAYSATVFRNGAEVWTGYMGRRRV